MTWPSAVATTTLPLATAGEDVTGEYLRPLDASNENVVDQMGIEPLSHEHVACG
jgi:hypothetical protein